MRSKPVIRVGTSGYQYNHWRGRFYPRDLPTSGWFAWYAERFDCVEINNSFYRLPGASVFDAWAAAAPRGFLFALKFSRFGSHMKKLTDPENTVEMFAERAVRLGRHLGPVLVQLPGRWHANPDRLAAFLGVARAWRGINWAFEFRDESWLCEEIYEILRHHNAALCIHDLLPDHPRILTANWTYLRFHGSAGKYAGEYGHDRLRPWVRWIREQVARQTSIYAFFNNDADAAAPRDAVLLGDMLTQARSHRAAG